MPRKKIWTIDAMEYEKIRSLGAGGSAVVWEARRKTDGQVVAIKIIAKSKDSAVRNKRFEREIDFGLRATHPNVLNILGRSEDDKNYYYVMDYFPSTLRGIIDNEFDPKVLLNYVQKLCDGLGYVHGEGIVHRDIKPENILVNPDSRSLVIADFGIAHFSNSMITKDGDLLVNRNYLAPEQMRKKNARGVGKPADIFALGLLIGEMFTKQNSRGRQPLRVRDRYPFMADLDPIIEQMMLQEEDQRLEIDNVRMLLRMLTQKFTEHVEELAFDLDAEKVGPLAASEDFEQTRDRASLDLLSARQIFERASDRDLARYNRNYHCEISYNVSSELYNLCAQSVAYALCRAKFDYEGAGLWSPGDDLATRSVEKLQYQQELEALLAEFPLPRRLVWSGLQQQTVHLFRFLKDYHCRELIPAIRDAIDDVQANLMNAPILWIVCSLRRYLKTKYLSLDRSVREEINLDNHLAIVWEETLPLDLGRVSVGAELFDETFGEQEVGNALSALRKNWDVSVGVLADGSYSVIFRTREQYLRFQNQALELAEPGSVFEADVLNLLRPESDNADFVALAWDRDFDTAVTLGKVVGTRSSRGKNSAFSADSTPSSLG